LCLFGGLGVLCSTFALHADKRAARTKQERAADVTTVQGIRFPKGTRFSYVSNSEPPAWRLVEVKLASELTLSGVAFAAGSSLSLDCEATGCYDDSSTTSCVSGTLARDQTIAGFPLRARTRVAIVCRHENCLARADSPKEVLEGTLAAEHVLLGRPFPAGTKLAREQDDFGACRYTLHVPTPMIIQGLRVQGYLSFDAAGGLEFAHVLDDVESSGIHCVGRRFDGIYLHPNGSLSRCPAALGLVAGCDFHGQVSFYDTGKPELIRIERACVLDGARIPPGTELHFDASGRMSVSGP
jgi:hypothetical protein